MPRRTPPTGGGATHSKPRRPAVALAVAVLVALLLAVPPDVAVADDPPAATSNESALLGGGWLARQVTADGRISGGRASATDEAWALLALRRVGVGATAQARLRSFLRLAAADPEGLQTEELALLTAALHLAGDDVRGIPIADPPADDGTAADDATSAEAVDLVAELAGRTQTSGPDTGEIGEPALQQDRVRRHALAMIALALAGEPTAEEHLRWLQEQQCPAGGWPVYRDAASRTTGTCEFLVPQLASTSAALQALALLDAPADVDPTGFLQAAATESGAWAPAVGLAGTPPATAHGIAAVRALSGRPPGEDWRGSQGTPQEVLVGEQLGCGWHGLDRGAVGPERHHAPEPQQESQALDPGQQTPEQRDADEDAGAEDAGAEDAARPEPGAAAELRDVAAAVLALADGEPWAAEVDEPVQGDPFPACPVHRDRVSGAGRIETAVAISQRLHDSGAEVAVLATARGFADALAAAPLAHGLAAPLLLTEPGELVASLAAELQRLGVREVVVVGGPSAVSTAVTDAVGALDGVESVRRISGANRFDTAARIAAELDTTDVVLVRGSGPEQSAWADAVAAGTWAASTDRALLLTGTDRLPAETAATLDAATSVVIVGGPSAVSQMVEEAARGEDGARPVRRLSGDTRYATAAAVFEEGVTAGLSVVEIWLATGADYPDALAAGAGAATAGASLLLVDPAAPDGGPSAREALLQVDYQVDQLVSVGGEAVLPASVSAELAALVRSESGS